MNEPRREPSYDFLRDAEELRRRRNDPSAQDDMSLGFTRAERYAFAGFVGLMLIVNVSLVVSILVR